MMKKSFLNLIFKKKKFKNKSAGFTIFEMMVAITIFLIVIIYGMGSILNANLLYRKSEDLRSVMDNLTFIMEDISRNARTGYEFYCGDNYNINQIDFNSDCLNGASTIVFKKVNDLDLLDTFAYQIKNNNIYRSINGSNFVLLNTDDIEINIKQSKFILSGSSFIDKKQPILTIRLSGKITYQGKQTPFSIQTSTSQRLLDFNINP